MYLIFVLKLLCIFIARICSIHFEESCFSLEKTKPRIKDEPAKEILRLIKGSIPTIFLNIEKRKGVMSQNEEKIKKIKVPYVFSKLLCIQL